MLNYLILGIDPGANGAAVIIDASTKKIVEQHLFPKEKGKFSPEKTVMLLLELMRKVDRIVVEDVHAISGSAAKATFSFGHTCGLIRAAVIVSGKPYSYTAPRSWQAKLWLDKDKVYKTVIKTVKKKKVETKKTDTKATSLNAALRLFPKHNFHIGKQKDEHDGVVDAALIALSLLH